MKATIHKCPSCSAPINLEAKECEFCGAEFLISDKGKIIKNIKDFGAKSNWFFGLILFGVVTFYILGWFFEDTNYWLNDKAVIIWLVILPIWILTVTSVWANKWGAILYGVIISLLIFISHTIIMGYYRNWHFNDDYFGISGMFAGGVLGAWLTGRLIHYLIKKSRNKNL